MAEKMQEAAAKNSSPLKRAVAKWAKSAATQHHTDIREGRRKLEDKPSWKYTLAKKLVFRFDACSYFYLAIH